MSTAVKFPENEAKIIAELVEQVSKLVSQEAGIQLGDRQFSMVENRLKKRMLDLRIDADAYREYLQSHVHSETQALVSLMTTHHTYFFREYSHFEYLESKGLAAAVENAKKAGRRAIRVWSAASSTGQEAYSLSMFLSANLQGTGMGYEILGTDVDPESVAIANNGVYHRKEIKNAPLHYLGNHWAKGTGDIAEFVKAKSSIKDACRFEPANLLKLGDFRKGDKFDLIFCRNVFIYFNQQQIKAITSELLSRLHPGGMLFLGISESLHGLNLPVASLGPSIYTRQADIAAPAPATAPAKAAAPAPASVAPAASPAAPLRLLCVDDSPSVLALLKQLFKGDSQFTVVATATNGLEAAKAIKEHKIDVMTLDIHMPEQDGLAYLKKNFGPSHPPVVMVSSVSRENADLAMECLTSGASDYVEKPALAEMATRGEEIRMKLLCAYRNFKNAGKLDISVDRAFAGKQEIKKPEEKTRFLVANLGDRKKLFTFLKEAGRSPSPPTVILVEGSSGALPAFAKDCQKNTGTKVELIETTDAVTLKAGTVYLGDFQKLADWAIESRGSRKNSLLIYGSPTKKLQAWFKKWPKAQVLVEDLGQGAKYEAPADVMAHTSFAYVSADFLTKGE